MAAVLYVVATPIGNLEDLSPRAQSVLGSVNLVAAEDTRHSGRLLRHFSIATPMISLHEHNEYSRIGGLVERLLSGQSIALVSDAGTPLVSDPGLQLVAAAHKAGIAVSPIPGPSALTAVLSVAGMGMQDCRFVGFLPHKASARRRQLQGLASYSGSLVIYESPHRVLDTLKDMVTLLGPEREAVMGRELTKKFETVLLASLAELQQAIANNADWQKGEFVFVVGAAPQSEVELRTIYNDEDERILRILMASLPTRQAVTLATGITGRKKNALYQLALDIERQDQAKT